MTVVDTITGETFSIHPFLADLPVFEAEVEAIAESIQEVGLLHPVTLDTEGHVIGGRHRLAACAKVGVGAEFETYDGDPLAFILHDNATRKHQSTGQRAAEVALSLDSAGHRSGGRWKRGTAAITESGNSGDRSSQRLTECGLILDHLGRDTLVSVALGERTLNDAYTQAEQVRDAAAQKALAAQQEAEREAKAQRFLEAEAPDLLAEVGGKYDTHQEAEAVWRVRNREEAEAKERKRKERAAAIKRHADYLSSWTASYELARDLRTNPDREAILAALQPTTRDRFLKAEDETWPTN